MINSISYLIWFCTLQTTLFYLFFFSFFFFFFEWFNTFPVTIPRWGMFCPVSRFLARTDLERGGRMHPSIFGEIHVGSLVMCGCLRQKVCTKSCKLTLKISLNLRVHIPQTPPVHTGAKVLSVFNLVMSHLNFIRDSHGCLKRLFVDFLTKMSYFTSQIVGNANN